MAVSGSVPEDTESRGLGSVPWDTSSEPGAPSPTPTVMSDATDPPFPNRADWQRLGENRRQCLAIDSRLGEGRRRFAGLYQFLKDRPRKPLQRGGAAEEGPTLAGRAPKGRARYASTGDGSRPHDLS